MESRPVQPTRAEQLIHSAAVSRAETQAATNTARLDALVVDISARLRGVCANLSEADFNALVLSIARTSVRFEEIEGTVPFTPADPTPPRG